MAEKIVKVHFLYSITTVVSSCILARYRLVESGTGTNLKVGGGHPSGAKHRKKCWGSCLSTFLVLTVQLVVLVSAFGMVSTVWSVSCLLFFYSRCPPVPSQL